MISRKLSGAVTFVVYLMAAVALLVPPLHGDLTHSLIAYPNTDPSTSLWELVWWPWAISHHINPILCKVVWHPTGQNLLWSLFIPVLAIGFWPVTALGGAFLSYNIIAVLSPAMAAWATWLLCREFTGKFWPAFFGGAVFGFSSFEFVQLLAHINLFVTFVLPLCGWLYLLRYRRKISMRRYVLSLAGLLILQFGIFTEVFATAVTFGLIAMIIGLCLERDPDLRAIHWSIVRETLVSLAVTACLLIPCLYYVFFHGYVHGWVYPPEYFSGDPLNFIVPTRNNLLGGGLFASYSRGFNGDRYELGSYLGIPLVLMIFFFASEFSAKTAARSLLLILAVIFVASLGGYIQTRKHDLPVALPWLVGLHMPLIAKALATRFSEYIFLAAAILAAWWLAESQKTKRLKITLSILAVIFMMPNTFSGRWAFQPENPVFFTSGQVTKYLPPESNLLILPYGYTGESMMWQEESHFYFSMAGGYLDLLVPRSFKRYPAITAFYKINPDIPDYDKQLKGFIRDKHVTAIVIADQDMPKYAALVAPLHIMPIHTGGVNLYLIPRHAVNAGK